MSETEILPKTDDKNVYGYTRSKFNGFGSYGKYDIEERVNEIVEATKKEYPTLDNYMIWLMATDYVLIDELKIDINEEEGKKIHDEFLKERTNLIYNSVQLCDENNNLLPKNEQKINI